MKKLFPLALMMAMVCASLSLQAQPAGWSYVKAFTIAENAGTNLYNYQVRLELDTQFPIAAGQMDLSGADILFGSDCQGTTLFNYWIESGINSGLTVIWIKIDTLWANSSRKIFMYYGNPMAMAASTLSVFLGPYSATDSVASGGAGGSVNSQRGFRFAPTEDLLVTSFGKYEPTGSARYVTLFDVASGSIILQTTVSGPAATYSYAPLPNPFWILAGTQYILTLYQGATDGYYFGTSSQIGQHMTYYDMRYCNSCTENTFPNSSLSNYHYGYPDLHYYIRQRVSPEPTISAASGVLSVDATEANVCFGNSVMLGVTLMNGEAPFTYQWTPPLFLDAANIGTPLCTSPDSIVYNVLVSDRYHCFASDSLHVNIWDVPVGAISGLDSLICVANPAVTLSGIPAGGTFSGTGVSGNSFDPAVAGQGTHLVFYNFVDTHGCPGKDSVVVVVSSCLGIEQETELPGISISPNPGNGVFVVHLSDELDVRLTLTDPTGKQLLEFASQNLPSVPLDLSTMTAGIYFLKVQGKSQSTTIRLIIQ
jgi:hypothetical protein